MRFVSSSMLVGFLAWTFSFEAPAQSLGSGTIDGTVTDQTGAAIPAALVELKNQISGYDRSAKTDLEGAFHFLNVPPNTYRVTFSASGFSSQAEEVMVRSSVPLALRISLSLAGSRETVTVEANGPALLENVPYAHNDVSSQMYSKLPMLTPASGLSDAITLASPGVVADSNGFFHPLGDHAQTTFSLDGQPISDQQSKQFSTQVPANAIQSMELITGAPGAEYGDKTSLVVNAVTRSGLGQPASGSFGAQYGSFGTVGEEATLGMGKAKLGNFLAANSLRSGRFLDTPEFLPVHDIGNNETLFDRLDWQPGPVDTFHLNLFGARNWFQVPNSYDQAQQDQRQRVLSYNLAPSYQHTYGAGAVLSVNSFVRRDEVSYYPSGNPFVDTPATVSEYRTLFNYGIRADYSYVHKVHNIKVGAQVMQTRLGEEFGMGITDPNFVDPAQEPGLLAYDLTRGGSLFRFQGRTNINEYALYAQDNITLGHLTLAMGFRFDQYHGLSEGTGLEPRVGASYLLKATGTVLRAAYSRTFETPYNENLILSSVTGAGGLATNVFGAFGSRPIQPGRRNQFNTGFEQSLGKLIQIDADYFWKYTVNAFDFGALLNTPLVFPISWRQSKIDGVALRISTADFHGFQAYTTAGHTRARYFGPSNGGLIFDSPLDTGVFRIDHDQAFEQTTNLTYRRQHNGPWAGFTWRYDSGEVAGAINGLADALNLTADQQAAIGFYCGAQRATLSNTIVSCSAPNYGATRLHILAPGTENDDHNPPRIAPRHLFDVAVGDDNLFHAEKVRTTLKITVANLTNTVALYNFLSTFSGTHFVGPRSYQVEMGVVF